MTLTPPIVAKAYSYPTTVEVREKYKKSTKEWLKSRRGDMPMQELGEKHLNCSKQFVNIVESGAHLPSNAVAVKWGNALDFSPLEMQLKSGTAPVSLLYELGWKHYDKFIKFLATLEP